MSNEYYLDMFADSIDDEEYIKDYQKNFAEDVKKILESEDINGKIKQWVLLNTKEPYAFIK